MKTKGIQEKGRITEVMETNVDQDASATWALISWNALAKIFLDKGK